MSQKLQARAQVEIVGAKYHDVALLCFRELVSNDDDKIDGNLLDEVQIRRRRRSRKCCRVLRRLGELDLGWQSCSRSVSGGASENALRFTWAVWTTSRIRLPSRGSRSPFSPAAPAAMTSTSYDCEPPSSSRRSCGPWTVEEKRREGCRT